MTAANLAPLPTSIGADSNGLLLSADEFDAVSDWDPSFRYELIHGVVVVLPPPGFGERSPNDELGYLLRTYRDNHPAGALLDGSAPEQDVACGANRRRADRAIWYGVGDGFDPDRDTPTIVVEFVSDSARDRRRDYIDKRGDYAAAGVAEYWVVDRFAQRLTVFRGDAESVVCAGETYSTPLLPGFELPLDKLLAAAGPRG